MSEEEYDIIFKLVLIGDSGVGKTNILSRYVRDEFSIETKSTVGVEFGSKIVKLNNINIKVQIWDTAGQERYMALNKNIFQKVQGIIIMYDLTSLSSFENVPRWLHLLSQNVSNKPKMLVANKLDLAENNRMVTEEEGQKLADENNIPFFEGSGSSGTNVDKIFTKMAEMVYENLIDEKETLKLNKKPTKNEVKKKCC